MSECLVIRRGSIETSKIPVLNSRYPEDQLVYFEEGSSVSVTFSIKIDTDGRPAVYTYQWYIDGKEVDDVVGESYTFRDISSPQTHDIYCVVSNECGAVISRTAILDVQKYAVPVLNPAYPADITTLAGSDVTFEVFIDVDGNPSRYTYQWYLDGVSVPGANLPSFTCTANADFSTSNVYCVVSNQAGVAISRVATLTPSSMVPKFTYSGTYKIVNDDDVEIQNTMYDWKIRFLTSGTLRFTSLNGAADGIDVFCVGGGGNGKESGGGGGGGYTTTQKGIPVNKDYDYAIVVGGSAGASSGFGVSANGGKSASNTIGGNGGSGGGFGNGDGGAGKGGSDGSNGYGNGSTAAGKGGGTGQGTTTREFGQSGATLYSGGGGGGTAGQGTTTAGGEGGGGAGKPNGTNGISGTANTGGGGGGCGAWASGGVGGSGIVIIRNAR